MGDTIGVCPEVNELGEGTCRGRRLTLHQFHWEGTIWSGSWRTGKSSPEGRGKNGILGRGNSPCRWPEGVETGRHLGKTGESAVAKVGDLGWWEGGGLREWGGKAKGSPLGRASNVSMKSWTVVGRQWAAMVRSWAGEKQGPLGAGGWEWDRLWKGNWSSQVPVPQASCPSVWSRRRGGVPGPHILHSRAGWASPFPALESGLYFEEGGLGGCLVEIEKEFPAPLAPFSQGWFTEMWPGFPGETNLSPSHCRLW